MNPLSESLVEQAALTWLDRVGWTIAHGPDIGPDGSRPERNDHGDVVLAARLRDALRRLNPDLHASTLEDACSRLTLPAGSTLEARNRAFHRMLVDGIPVEYRVRGGEIRGDLARAIDFGTPANNDFLAVSQFTVIEGRNRRRPDGVLFVNGLPLGVIELKSPGDPDATVRSAWNQLQTYKAELPTLFAMNELMAVADGVEARVGTLTGGWEWFKRWRTISGEEKAASSASQLQVAIEGLFAPTRLLPYLRDFIVLEDDGSGGIVKKMAGYHQFHAVRVAVEETLRAIRPRPGRLTTARKRAPLRTAAEPGDRRVGVVWHTQGSGKSLTMAFYAGCIVREPAMGNPTLVVVTDRNDLDNQLFHNFSLCRDLLRQPPVQAEDRADLRRRLSVKSGGVVFTTIQKFLPEEKGDRHPLLSDRRNVVVIADEAHRSQYDFIRGFAGHLRDALPGASFIGFTGTPIEQADRSTRAVFGDHISVYDIQRAQEDRATVPIYYESRLAQVGLDEAAKAYIDPQFEEVTEGEEVSRKERLKTKWAQLEAIVGTDERLDLVARDIVAHYERRCEALEGKAMVVCMSRRICVELYRRIASLRPGWHGDEDDEGAVKVVMTGSASDPVDWQPHIRNKSRRQGLARRFRDPDDPFCVVLVRDMWLTGFDAPSLHTMYVDKPMRAHGLMQAITRVNRVFRDKPGGLVVDYLGLAHELRRALATYTASGGRGRTTIDQREAVQLMLKHHEICLGILYGFDWSAWTAGTPDERLALLPAAQEHVLAQENGKDRFVGAVNDLSRAFALAVPHDDAMRIRDDVGFFQTVRNVLAKRTRGETRTDEELDHAVRQIIAGAVAPEGVVDIYASAGLSKPDISILSEEFLAEVRDMPHRNLAVEVLRKLLAGEVRARRRRNVVQGRSFAEMLERTVQRYRNRAVEAAQVIEELIALAKEMRDADRRGEELGLSDEELAFYDALETNDSAVQVLGDEVLRGIARELVDTVKRNTTIDWTMREDVRARLRVMVKRILRRHGYPPDKQEAATRTVLKQAEALSEEWVG